jgi:GLPGLI family protein
MSVQTTTQKLQKEGVITYSFSFSEEKMKEYSEKKRTIITAMMTKQQYQLIFNDKAAVWKNVNHSVDIEDTASSATKTVGVPKEFYYQNFKENQFIKRINTPFKSFLVESKPAKADWQLTERTAVILGYTCYEAISADSKIRIYFTKEIPVFIGPFQIKINQGCILKYVEMNTGRQITATKIDFKKLHSDDLERPIGKVMTKEAYKIAIAQLQKMIKKEEK